LEIKKFLSIFVFKNFVTTKIEFLKIKTNQNKHKQSSDSSHLCVFVFNFNFIHFSLSFIRSLSHMVSRSITLRSGMCSLERAAAVRKREPARVVTEQENINKRRNTWTATERADERRQDCACVEQQLSKCEQCENMNENFTFNSDGVNWERKK
jgi:hypothetical protein